MESFKVQFDSIGWQDALPGARFKAFRDGARQLRLLELTSAFVEPQWCEKGHAGIVLQGELEIDFQGRVVKYGEGTGIFIPAGASSAHKAKAVSSLVLLFLVEDV
jgi:hypothetical protein